MSAATAHAQDPQSEPQPQPKTRSAGQLLNVVPPITNVEAIQLRDAQAAMEVPQPPEPPAGAAAWSLRVHTTGGFAGQGVGSITISSDGQVECGPAPCGVPVAGAQLKPVSTTLASIVDATWIRRAPSGLCRDCVQTIVVLKRREGDLVRTYVASWDDSQAPTQELRELRRLALELRAALAPR